VKTWYWTLKQRRLLRQKTSAHLTKLGGTPHNIIWQTAVFTADLNHSLLSKILLLHAVTPSDLNKRVLGGFSSHSHRFYVPLPEDGAEAKRVLEDSPGWIGALREGRHNLKFG